MGALPTAAVPAWLPTTAPDVRPGWADDSACSGNPDTNRWFNLPPIRTNGRANPGYDAHLRPLQAICGGCPVRVECAWESLANPVEGVWAGLDEIARAEIGEALGLTDPVIAAAPDEEAREIAQRRIAARRYARRTSMTNARIAGVLGVSPMTVSRLLDDRDPSEIPTRTKRAAA